MVRTLHKDVKKLKLETLYHRILTEYYINSEKDLCTYIGVVLLSPCPRWSGDMHYPVMDDIFFRCIHEKIPVIRFTYQSMEGKDKDEEIKQYIAQSNVCIDYFMDVSRGNLEKIVIVGSHTGAYIAREMHARRPIVAGTVLINPSFLHYNYTNVMTHESPNQHIILGKDDNYAGSLVELYCKKVGVSKENIHYLDAGGNNLQHLKKDVTSIVMKSIGQIVDDSMNINHHEEDVITTFIIHLIAKFRSTE